MRDETVREKRARRRANYHFTSHWSKLPRAYSRGLTAERLVEDGFKEIAERYYTKCFSGVLELRFHITRRGGKRYDWILNIDPLKEMVAELKGIQKEIDRERAKSLRLFQDKASWGLNGRVRRGGRFPEDWIDAAHRIARRKQMFLRRYEEFLAVLGDVGRGSHYFRKHIFFLDVCRTTNELKVFLKFVELYMHVFVGLRTAKSEKALSGREVKECVIAYCVFYRVVRRIRDVWKRGIDYEDLVGEFPMIDADLLYEITLDRGRRKGWKSGASDIARRFAAQHVGTAQSNVKQILKQEKKYLARTMELVAAVPEPEKMLTREERVPLLWPDEPRRLAQEKGEDLIESLFTSLGSPD